MDNHPDTRPSQSGKFSKRVVTWIMAVGAILAIIAALMFCSITLLLKSEGWVAHSYQVLDALDLTEAHFSDAQASERGYAATCKPALLSPFHRDLPQIFTNLGTLRHLTADNPMQLSRTNALAKAVSGELERMSVVITTASAGHQREAEAMLDSPGDTKANRQISSLINAMQAEERTILVSRIKNVTLFAWTTLVSFAVGVLMIGGILAFVLRLIKRETARREATENNLHESNQRLGTSLLELEKYNASAKAISLLGELLQTCRSTDEAVSISLRHVQEILPDSSVAIALFNDTRESVDVVQRQGDSALFAPQFQASDCWGLRRGRKHESGPAGFEPQCDHVESPGQFVVCVPMNAQGETLGVLTVAGPIALAEFEDQTLRTIAEQLSLAVANLTLQESLRNQSLRDPLTTLYNRRYMNDAMHREIARADRQNTPLAVAMLDIDHFKRFNDSYGHDGGDALLQAFGKLLVSHARSDDIICRYGGEEFALILPGATLETAAARLDEMRLAVKKMQVHANGVSLGSVSMSVGVAIFPRDGSTGESLLAAADAALYTAKRDGRDRVACASAATKKDAIA